MLRPMIVFLHNFVHTNKKWFQLHTFDKSRKKIKDAPLSKKIKGALFISGIHFLLLIRMLISILIILKRIFSVL